MRVTCPYLCTKFVYVSHSVFAVVLALYCREKIIMVDDADSECMSGAEGRRSVLSEVEDGATAMVAVSHESTERARAYTELLLNKLSNGCDSSVFDAEDLSMSALSLPTYKHGHTIAHQATSTAAV